jgi:hypothetical protein
MFRMSGPTTSLMVRLALWKGEGKVRVLFQGQAESLRDRKPLT